MTQANLCDCMSLEAILILLSRALLAEGCFAQGLCVYLNFSKVRHEQISFLSALNKCSFWEQLEQNFSC